MLSFSKRSQTIESSGVRRVFDLAATLKNPINLSIGQPSFDAFPEMKEAVQSALQAGKSGYTQTQGIAPLRQAIARQYDCSDGTTTHASGRSCFLTSGVSGGIFLAYLCLLDPGDEVLIPDPYFVMYKDLASLINSQAVCYDTYPDFRVRVEAMEAKVTKNTKAILLASPNNPTGANITPEELAAVIDFAKFHDLWIIYDEIYSAFSYDAPHTKLVSDYEKVLILNGYSKSHGVPGWRVGYAVGPDSLVQQMLKVQQYSFVCTPSIAQWGVLAGVDHDFTETLSDYRKKRDFLYHAIADRYEIVKPSGAFYLFPKVPHGTGAEFFERCVEKNLLLVPGGVFSSRDTHVRISFSASFEQLERGAEVLRSLAQ